MHMQTRSIDPRRTVRHAALGAAVAGAALLTALGGASAAEPAWCAPQCGTLVARWSEAAYATLRADNGYANPMAATRVLSMMHLAMHDAVNAVEPRFAHYALATRDPRADPVVAGVTAAHAVLAALYPKQTAFLDAELTGSLLDAGIGPRVARGTALGKAAAAAILDARADDGASGDEPYSESKRPGGYRFTPGFTFIAAPAWRQVKPFALTSPRQFRVGPPPALASDAYTRAFEEVKAVGGKASTARTPEQTTYAAFWYEFSDIGWNRIARTVSAQAKLDLWSSARLFALVNMVMADGYIAGWDSKMHYDFWRPVTAIRLAESDGNGRTAPDTAWESLLPTPPIQDHPSTHSVLGAAAAVALAEVMGTDAVAFEFASSSALPEHPRRAFTSFRAAAQENADSRIRAGLHFRFATDAGLELGETIGRYTLANYLKPLD